MISDLLTGSSARQDYCSRSRNDLPVFNTLKHVDNMPLKHFNLIPKKINQNRHECKSVTNQSPVHTSASQATIKIMTAAIV